MAKDQRCGHVPSKSYSVPLRRRMLNCSGVRMACHSSSDLCTGPGGGVDDDIADTPGNLRPAARPLHGRGAGRGRAAAGEGARRREDSGREARGGAGARVRCHPQPQQTLDANVVALVALRIMWSGDEERVRILPACLPGLGLGCSSTRTRRPRHLLSI